jgi:hypothetical protein
MIHEDDQGGLLGLAHLSTNTPAASTLEGLGLTDGTNACGAGADRFTL